LEQTKKNRIWELDAFRGICIIGVIIVHLIFDLQSFFGILTDMPEFYVFIQDNGGILFILLSGICVTLGKHHIKRGLLVAAGAFAVTFVTFVFLDEYFRIYFGILHLIAVCMLTYGLYRRLHHVFALVIGTSIVIVGYWFETFYVTNEFLFPLGLTTPQFTSADYFPIFPFLGFFMIGTFLGKTVYRKKETLFPKVNEENIIIKSLSWCGKNSFFIYLLHQPLLYGGFMLAEYLLNK
jgi:uncharacterized membrane protein